MTSQGSPHSRFARALATGNPLLVRAAAAELPRVDLADALAICLVLARAGDGAYSRAAARFAARWTLELPGVRLEEAQTLNAAMQTLMTCDMAAVGARLLNELARARGLGRVQRVLRESGHELR